MSINAEEKASCSITKQLVVPRRLHNTKSASVIDDNWNVDIRFQDRAFKVVGRLPLEKRQFLKELPKKLGLHTRAKLHTIPPRGIFCKFFSDSFHHMEKMKRYMEENRCALCEHFVLRVYNCTLFMILPSTLESLSCLKRLKRTGASANSIQSLCTDKDGVAIGFIVMEENPELVERLHQNEKRILELSDTAELISKNVGDALLNFELLLDQLDTKASSAIQVCSTFIIQHQNQYADALCERLCTASDMLHSSKSKANIVFVAHEVVKHVRAHFPQEERNEKMKQSILITALERVLFHLTESLPKKVLESPNVMAVFDYWDKWELMYRRAKVSSAKASHKDRGNDQDVSSMEDTIYEFQNGKSGAGLSSVSTSPEETTSPLLPVATQSVRPAVSDLIEAAGIQAGVWEVYLSRATEAELEELKLAMQYNFDHHAVNTWESLVIGGSGRRNGEFFLHHYVKTNMPALLNPTKGALLDVKQGHQTNARSKSEIMLESFVCTWDLDDIAVKAIMDVEVKIIEDIWKKMEVKQCFKPSAFVFGTVRKIKSNQFAVNPSVITLMEKISSTDQSWDETAINSEVIRVFQLDKVARDALHKLHRKEDLCRIIKSLCDRCRQRMVANPSVHVVKLVKALEAEYNPKKGYSVAMRSQLSKQFKLSTSAFGEKQEKKRKLDKAGGYQAKSEVLEEAFIKHVDMSDAELAAMKEKIPKPPRLRFKKVDLSTVTHQEVNENGTVGVAISGIPNAGRGLFNLSSHSWPAFSVVCIFGSRRISQEMHHDGLNKVARCGELGDTFVIVNGVVREVETFQIQYGHRLVTFDGLVDAEGSMGGFPNDRVYQYPESIYWDASSFYNNCILVPGCLIEPNDTAGPIRLDQLYIVTWKEVHVREEFFLAYGTSYYEDDYKNIKR